MKKRSLLAFAVLIQATLGFSQTIHKGNFSLTVGPAFPMGHFAKANLSDPSSGFAKTGQTIAFSYTKPVLKNWGFLINLTGQRNPFNTNALESIFSKTIIYQGFFYSDPYNPPQQQGNIYPNWKFENKSWLYAALQVGTKGQFYLEKEHNTWLTTNATIGVLHAKSPKLEGSSITDTAIALFIQNKSAGFGFLYSFGIGLNHFLNKRVFLTSNLNYIGTNKVTFKNVQSTITTTKGMPGTVNYSIQQLMSTVNVKENFSSINLLLGFGIIL